MRASILTRWIKGKGSRLTIRPVGSSQTHEAGTVIARDVLFTKYSGMLAEYFEDFERVSHPRLRDNMFSPLYWPEAKYNPVLRRYEDKDTGTPLRRAKFVYITSNGKIRYFQ